jgi:hypothetical protein
MLLSSTLDETGDAGSVVPASSDSDESDEVGGIFRSFITCSIWSMILRIPSSASSRATDSVANLLLISSEWTILRVLVRLYCISIMRDLTARYLSRVRSFVGEGRGWNGRALRE